jgi:hypothetical protein
LSDASAEPPYYERRFVRPNHIGLTYSDTSGHTKFCYNTALATCRVILRDSTFGHRELIASRRAMLEILLAEPLDGVPLLA